MCIWYWSAGFDQWHLSTNCDHQILSIKMSDNLLSNFSQGNDNFSFWDDVVMDGALPKQLLQDDDNTNSQGLHHVGCFDKDVFPLNSCEEINFTQCMMELDNSEEDIPTFDSTVNCEMQTYFDLNIHDLLQPENCGFDDNMMNCVNVFQMSNLSVFPGIRDESTARVDDVEQWSCCSPKKGMGLFTEENLTNKDNECFQVSNCAFIPVIQGEFSKRGNSVEQLPICSSPVKTNEHTSDEIFATEDCTVCDDVFQVNDISQLLGSLDDCSERERSAIQSSNCSSKKATKLMEDEIFVDQDSTADDDSSNGESVIYESDNGERLTLGPTSQQHLSCCSSEDSKSNVGVNNPVNVSGLKTSVPVLSSNMIKEITADCNALKPKRFVLQVIRKPNSDSATKMLAHQTDYTDVLEITSQPSFVNRNGNIVVNHRSTGDESDSTVDNLPQNLNKSALQARLNREKKKAYIAGLEKQMGIMKKEKVDLERKVNSLEEKSAALDDQVMYLKSVLANESVLAKLISNINGSKTAELSSSSVMGKKRKLDENCNDRGTKVLRSSGTSSGICLHVSDERLSLELCHHCAQSSEIANRPL